jgi:hypothetical protein
MKDKKLREYLEIEEDEYIGMFYRNSCPILRSDVVECESCGYLIMANKAYKKLEICFNKKKREEYAVPHYYCKKCFKELKK